MIRDFVLKHKQLPNKLEVLGQSDKEMFVFQMRNKMESGFLYQFSLKIGELRDV